MPWQLHRQFYLFPIFFLQIINFSIILSYESIILNIKTLPKWFSCFIFLPISHIFYPYIHSQAFTPRLMSAGWKGHIMMSTVVDNFFDQWNPCTVTPMEEVCGPQRGTMLKNKPHLVTFHEGTLVSSWIFQATLVFHIHI